MNEHPLIGCYALNCELLPVYYDTVSQETYYVDEQGCAYLLTGLAMETTNPVGVEFSTLEALAEELPDGIVGIIHDGDSDWLLAANNTAFNVPKGTLDTSAFLVTATYEDDMEYEPEEEDGMEEELF